MRVGPTRFQKLAYTDTSTSLAVVEVLQDRAAQKELEGLL